MAVKEGLPGSSKAGHLQEEKSVPARRRGGKNKTDSYARVEKKVVLQVRRHVQKRKNIKNNNGEGSEDGGKRVGRERRLSWKEPGLLKA